MSYQPSIEDIQIWLRWAGLVLHHPAKADRYYRLFKDVIDQVEDWHKRTREEWKRQQTWESWQKYKQEQQITINRIRNKQGGNDD